MYTNSSTPPCTRTLTRYSEYKKTNSRWYSLPFYSRDIKGYKLKLRVDANGDGSGEGTHLSLCVFMLKGEYDDQLQWPLNANITVQVLNWSGDNSHEEKTIDHHTPPLEYRTRVTEGYIGYLVERVILSSPLTLSLNLLVVTLDILMMIVCVLELLMLKLFD